jgi:hypothetical protein
MAQIAPVLAGYQSNPVMTILKKRELVLCSLFILFIYNGSEYQHFNHKAGSHKFDNSWLPWLVLTNWL